MYCRPRRRRPPAGAGAPYRNAEGVRRPTRRRLPIAPSNLRGRSSRRWRSCLRKKCCAAGSRAPARGHRRSRWLPCNRMPRRMKIAGHTQAARPPPRRQRRAAPCVFAMVSFFFFFSFLFLLSPVFLFLFSCPLFCFPPFFLFFLLFSPPFAPCC